MKQIIPFFAQNDSMTLKDVSYFENIDKDTNRPQKLSAKAYIVEPAPKVEIHIGNEYKTYIGIGDENIEFIEQAKGE